MLVLLFLLGLGVNSSFADDAVGSDTISPPQAPGEDEVVDPVATIAPIHTKEPEVKPPVEQPSGIPVITSTTVTRVETPTQTQTVTQTPTETAEASDEGNLTAEEYYDMAKILVDSGNYSGALEDLNKALVREPYYADALYLSYICQSRLGNTDDAYESYRRLILVNPDYRTDKSNSTENNQTIISNLENTATFDIRIIGLVIVALIFGGWGALYIQRRKGGKNITGGQRQYGKPKDLVTKISDTYTGDPHIVQELLKIAIEIAREGREGKKVGTAFIIGDTDKVLEKSRQLILNPVQGHSDSQRLITNPDMRENLKELSQVDGAFVIRENGIVEAAGRYISIDTSGVHLQKGLGTRHVSVAAITKETNAIGIVVSESGGIIRIFQGGKVIAETP